MDTVGSYKCGRQLLTKQKLQSCERHNFRLRNMQGAVLAASYVAQGRCHPGWVTRFSNGVWVALQDVSEADKPASAWLYGPYVEEKEASLSSACIAMESAQEINEVFDDASAQEPDAYDEEEQLLSPVNPALYLVRHTKNVETAVSVTRVHYLFAAQHEMRVKALLCDWIPTLDRVPNWGNLSLPLSQWRCLDEGVVATDPVTGMPTTIRLVDVAVPRIPASLAHLSALKVLTMERCSVDVIDEGAFGALARVCIVQNGSCKLTQEGLRLALLYNVGLEEAVLL